MTFFDALVEWFLSLFTLPPAAPVTPQEPPTEALPPQPTPEPPAPAYVWDTVDALKHSMRVIGDEYNMTVLQKDLLCDICYCESRYNIRAKLTNSPKSVDRGLFQWNNYYHPEITDEIAYNPEATTRLACKAILAGKAHLYWSASEHCWNKTGRYTSLL